MQDTSTATIEEISFGKNKIDIPVKPLSNAPNGAFSNATRLELSPEEYDELVELLADPEPAQFSESAKKAIREELIRMERTREEWNALDSKQEVKIFVSAEIKEQLETGLKLKA